MSAIVFHVKYIYFFQNFYFKGRAAERGRERRVTDLPSPGSLPTWLQRAELTQFDPRYQKLSVALLCVQEPKDVNHPLLPSQAATGAGSKSGATQTGVSILRSQSRRCKFSPPYHRTGPIVYLFLILEFKKKSH